MRWLTENVFESIPVVNVANTMAQKPITNSCTLKCTESATSTIRPVYKFPKVLLIWQERTNKRPQWKLSYMSLANTRLVLPTCKQWDNWVANFGWLTASVVLWYSTHTGGLANLIWWPKHNQMCVSSWFGSILTISRWLPWAENKKKHHQLRVLMCLFVSNYNWNGSKIARPDHHSC